MYNQISDKPRSLSPLNGQLCCEWPREVCCGCSLWFSDKKLLWCPCWHIFTSVIHIFDLFWLQSYFVLQNLPGIGTEIHVC